jgi:predicted transcriptional regulator
MPQSERSNILKKLLKWLASLEKETTTAGIHSYVRNEITELGATSKTIQGYIEDLSSAGFIEYMHPFWKITKAGRDWLEHHSV